VKAPGRHPDSFLAHDIDETVLPGLTHETLRELGVASVGHRVKLLDAIAALRNDESGKAPSADAATASGAPSAPIEDRATSGDSDWDGRSGAHGRRAGRGAIGRTISSGPEPDFPLRLSAAHLFRG
jgi:hypothetical protein